jgi:2-polyprenyl-3-methyl-5-hydroxy-6-metoxy-1,4-benzoquinol methylase
MTVDARKKLIESEAQTREYNASKYSDWVEDILSYAAGDILDLGSGDGAFSLPLIKKGLNVISADLSHKRLKSTKSINRRLAECDALILPFKDNSFDTILFVEVLEHLPNKQAQEVALKEFIRILKPNGRLVLTTPNKAVYKYAVQLWSWFGGKSPDPTHYTELSLTELMEICGKYFNITHVRGKLGFIPIRALQRYFSKHPGVCYDILVVAEPK